MQLKIIITNLDNMIRQQKIEPIKECYLTNYKKLHFCIQIYSVSEK